MSNKFSGWASQSIYLRFCFTLFFTSRCLFSCKRNDWHHRDFNRLPLEWQTRPCHFPLRRELSYQETKRVFQPWDHNLAQDLSENCSSRHKKSWNSHPLLTCLVFISWFYLFFIYHLVNSFWFLSRVLFVCCISLFYTNRINTVMSQRNY